MNPCLTSDGTQRNHLAMIRGRRTSGQAPGRMLRSWRKHHGLSIEAAATRMGVTRQTYARWEKGRKPPGFDTWVRIDDITDGQVPWHVFAKPSFATTIARIISRSPLPITARQSATAEESHEPEPAAPI